MDLEKSNCNHGVTLDFDTENWAIKTNFTNYQNTENARVKCNLHFKQGTYTITYDAFGGSGAPESQTKTYGVDLTLSSTTPTRTGYTFLGWSTLAGATSATYQAGATFSENANTTLYAVWKANTYTITYNANGGSGAPGVQRYTYDSSGTINLSATKPTRSGYTFLGWSQSSTASSASYSAGQAWSRSNASNYTLYAVWKSNYSTSTATYSGGIFVVGADGYIVAGQPGVKGAGWNLTRNNITGGTISWNGAYSSLRANTACSVNITGSISALPTDGYTWYTYRATLFIDGVNQGDLWWTGEQASAGGAGKSTTISRTISLKAGQTFEIRLSGGHDNDRNDRTGYSFSFQFLATPNG